METGKPQISILMAVYEPRMDWLREQLLSLNAQTYPNLKLHVRDDCSPTVSYDAIQSCVKDCIRAFPYEIKRNEKNLGSNGTFELLTQEADGDYFAYCDQDDVWLPEKLVVLQKRMEESSSELVCSDMYIIDGEGKQVADSITKVRRHHVFHSGTDLAPELLVSNFVTGCTMLVRAGCAKEAVPFCPYMVHDHYLALWCAQHGRIHSVGESLIRYRVHQTNQTGLMTGVTSRETYYILRIRSMLKRFRWLQMHFPCDEVTQKKVNEGLCWLTAREKNWKKHRGARIIWRYRHFSITQSLFELVVGWMPESFFRVAITAIKKNWV